MAFEPVQAIGASVNFATEDVSDAEETACLDRARAGDSPSVDWLVNRYRVRAVRLAMVVLGRSGEAEDAAQEAFIKAFRNLHLFRGEGSFKSWLFRIVVRVCLDRTRRPNWNAEVELNFDDDTVTEIPAVDTDANLRIAVTALLGEMKPAMRAILTLREIEGLDYAEIASILGIPAGRVKWRLHTARKDFQALWTKMEEEVRRV